MTIKINNKINNYNNICKMEKKDQMITSRSMLYKFVSRKVVHIDLNLPR